MIEEWKSAIDKGTSFGALLIHLSKRFDCLRRELFFAKLHASGISIASLRLLYSYLTNLNQKTKINSAYSSWKNILFQVPH